MLGYYSQRSDKFGNTINQNSENFYNLWVGFKKKNPKNPRKFTYRKLCDDDIKYTTNHGDEVKDIPSVTKIILVNVDAKISTKTED